MADIQLINLGSAPGAGDGENLRSGGEKINGNFQNLNNQANGLDSRVEALETSGDSASFGNGLQVDAITKVVSVKAKVEGGIAVSADGVQISADLAQTINDKATEEALQAVAEDVGENGQAIADLQNEVIDLREQVGQAGAVDIATQTDIAAGTVGKVIDAAGLKTAGITTSAINTIAGKTGGKLAAGYNLFTTSASSSGTFTTPEIASTGYNTNIGFGFYAKITYATSANTSDGYLYTNFGSSIKSWVFEGSSGILYSPGGVQQSCDRRLKTEIELIPDALNKVTKIAGCTFVINDTSRAGIIAQDLQAVLPEAIQISPVEIEKDGIKINNVLTVDAMGVIGLLVEAVKELSAKVEMLESRSA